MRQWAAWLGVACLAALAFLVSGCATGEPVPPEPLPPLLQAPASAPSAIESPPTAVRDGVVFPDIPSSEGSPVSTVSPLPPRPPLYPMTPPSVSFPVGAAPNVGPITGYGAGGMGHIPGSPPNPPYN
jgi:hypothetical protein